MNKLKGVTRLFIMATFCAFVTWVAASTMVQRFKCQSLTETELFLRISKSFVLDFKDC